MLHLARRRLTSVLFVVTILSLAPACVASEIPWRRDPPAAQQEALRLSRPILIYVESDSCVYCRQLERSTWTHNLVAWTVTSRFVPLQVDSLQNPGLVQQLQVQSLPSTFVVTPQGFVIGRLDGFREPAEMQAFLQQHLPADNTARLSPPR